MPTDPRRAFAIAEAALDQPHDRHAKFLSEACRGDTELRAAVDVLLEEGSRSSGILKEPWCRLTEDPSAPAPVESEIGRMIGHYRLLRELGRGGMGTVYLAERTDGEFERRVALKVLKKGMDTDEFVQRFRNERQILANLRHPNVADFYEGGTTPEGQPYLIMEHIDGAPLDEYCEAHDLTVRRRLELFLRVCSGVQYAHQHLVVHRDLKPGNILVTPEAEPKLLDFGIAKLLHPETFLPITGTVSSARPMTPEYASPEQVLGEPITVASDVYSLGVLLYRLLTGHPPYHLKLHTESELRRVICEEEPPRPSDSLSGGRKDSPEGGNLKRLRRQLRGDLDQIVLKALRKPRDRRYPSVEEFAQDIRRHLDSLPIKARQETLSYRARKFVHRRPKEIAAGVAVLAGLVLFGAREYRLTRQVSAERDKAQELALFLKGLFEQSDPNQAPGALTVRELLDRGARKIDHLGDRPDLQALYLETIGDAYRGLGLYDQSLPLLQRTLSIRRRLHGEEHAAVAEAFDDIGETLYFKGDLVGAESHYRHALALRQRLLGVDDPELADVSSSLGVLLQDKGNYPDAEPLLREAVRIQRATLGDGHPSTASALNNLAVLLHDKGDLADAERMYRGALETWRNVYGKDHPQIATALNNLGVVLADKEDYAASEPHYREALAMRQRVLGEDHPDTLQSVSAVGFILFRRGDYGSAEPFLRDAMTRRRRVLGQDHVSTAMTEVTLGRLLLETGNVPEAESLVRGAIAKLRRQMPEGNNWHAALAEGVLGMCLTRQGRVEEAEPLLLRSHSVLQAQRGSSARVTRDAAAWVVSHYRARGMLDRAERFRALAEHTSSTGE